VVRGSWRLYQYVSACSAGAGLKAAAVGQIRIFARRAGLASGPEQDFQARVRSLGSGKHLRVQLAEGRAANPAPANVKHTQHQRNSGPDQCRNLAARLGPILALTADADGVVRKPTKTCLVRQRCSRRISGATGAPGAVTSANIFNRFRAAVKSIDTLALPQHQSCSPDGTYRPAGLRSPTRTWCHPRPMISGTLTGLWSNPNYKNLIHLISVGAIRPTR